MAKMFSSGKTFHQILQKAIYSLGCCQQNKQAHIAVAELLKILQKDEDQVNFYRLMSKHSVESNLKIKLTTSFGTVEKR